MVITSISNERVKFFRSLRDASGRKKSGCFLVEGWNSVKDIPSDAKVVSFYVKESKVDAFQEVLSKRDVETIVLSDELFDRVSDTVTPIGIAAVVEQRISSDISDINSNKLIILDHVSDAGNVGAILRTAVAAGYEAALLVGGADPYSPKAVRASMSAIFKLRLYFCDLETILCSKNLNLYDIIVLDMQGDDIFRFVPRSRYALVVGNEAHGVSEELKQKGKKVSIPMHSMESLNAAVSAGIAMYVIGRQ